MPKRVAAVPFEIPETIRCDFCGRIMKPFSWNERTCFRCEQSGCPNQSKLGWGAYQRALLTYLRSIGRRRALPGVAARPAPHEDRVLRPQISPRSQ